MRKMQYELLSMHRFWRNTMNYDVIIIGAGPGGIFSAYELTQRTTRRTCGF